MMQASATAASTAVDNIENYRTGMGCHEPQSNDGSETWEACTLICEASLILILDSSAAAAAETDTGDVDDGAAARHITTDDAINDVAGVAIDNFIAKPADVP